MVYPKFSSQKVGNYVSSSGQSCNKPYQLWFYSLVRSARSAKKKKTPSWHNFSPRDRQLSANHHLIMKLESKLTEVKRALEQANRENKVLKRIQHRQEKDLDKYEAEHGALPQLLTRHSEEVSFTSYLWSENMSSHYQWHRKGGSGGWIPQ